MIRTHPRPGHATSIGPQDRKMPIDDRRGPPLESSGRDFETLRRCGTLTAQSLATRNLRATHALEALIALYRTHSGVVSLIAAVDD